MNRARFTFAATLIGASLVGGAAVLAQTPQASPMTSVLSGKKFIPPLRGQADVAFTKPVTKREKDMVVTRVQVKNLSNAPIPRLTIKETWFDKNNQPLPGGQGIINGLLQPGEIQTIEIQTPYDSKMNGNSFTFSHANGTVKPQQVAKFDVPPPPPGAPAAKK